MLEEMKINESDKKRIVDYIKENDLDFNINDNELFKFSIISSDDMVFHVYNYNEQFVLVKYDPKKDMQSNLQGDPGIIAYEYYYYKNIQQVIEQLSLYDNSIYKEWWTPLISSINIEFHTESYKDDWSNNIINNENYKIENNENYKYLIYEEKRNISVSSPFNLLHEVSMFNTYSPTNINKLYFEIHPIKLTEGKESNLVKILINNEEIMKEYINYRVDKKN